VNIVNKELKCNLIPLHKEAKFLFCFYIFWGQGLKVALYLSKNSIKKIPFDDKLESSP